MRVVLRMFLAALTVVSASATIAACSGGGGSSSEPQGPPPPPFAVTLDTGLAIGLKFDDIAVIGNFALVGVSEAETGADLNGDGDQFDSVAHLLDIAGNVAVNLRLALLGKPVASDQQFAFLVPELDQQSDLNGDGDKADAVWHLLDPAVAISDINPLNTVWSTPLSGRPGIGVVGGMILIVSEFSMSADFTGDGDTLDDVVFAVEHFGRTILPLGIPPHAPGTPLVARGRRVLVCGSEAAAGMDLTGDRDTNDIIMGAISFDETGFPTYQQIGLSTPLAVDPTTYVLTDTMAVCLVSEGASGAADFNGDGDANDLIIVLSDLQSNRGVFFPTASSVGTGPLAADVNFGFAASGNRILFGIDENSQGQDLNNDQDTADSILAWIDPIGSPSIARVVGLTLGSVRPVIDGTTGLVSINEAGSALVTGVDYNADGDINDQVAFRIDVSSAPAVMLNLERAVEGFMLSGTDAVLMISETAQFGIDLNGDTDTNDAVAAYVDLGRLAPSYRPLGFALHSLVLNRTDSITLRLALLAPEQPLTTRADVNGDGDSLDNAHFWIDIDTAPLPPVVKPPTPYLIGIGAFSTAPPIVIDADTLLFPTNETMLGRDLNGDGDSGDTLLRIVTRSGP